MSVNLKVTLGTVNYTDWLHVTASKVSSPSVIAWEDWIDVPVTNYNFVITGLDPDNYYVRYYDAPTNSSLGTLVAELLINALTNEIISERKFYTCGGVGVGDPADGSTSVTDPYLIGKNVTGCFKEGFRYFKPTDEYSFDDTLGTVAVLTGTTFATDEKFIVEITYKVSSTGGSSGGGLYNGTLDVPEATKTLLVSDKNKRIRCIGSAATQEITLFSLSAVAVDEGVYIDNSCGGTAVQVKILFNGDDSLRFNGFMTGSDILAEIWVSKGEFLLIRKFDTSYWELIMDYKGVEVGSRQASAYKSQAAWLPEDGSLKDGDEYPRLWWWITHVLPSSHVITDDAVIGAYTWPTGKNGLFVKHSTLKKFRMPDTQGLSEKGLKTFGTYGADLTRTYDYPGGKQEGQIMAHRHYTMVPLALSSGSYPSAASSIVAQNDNGPADFKYIALGHANEPSVSRTSQAGSGTDNIVPNVGVIYMRHI